MPASPSHVTDRLMLMASWHDFEAEAPSLAAFGEERLTAAAAYLATLRLNGTPRVHSVAPIVGGGRLFVFIEPTSPKARDLCERDWYALHNGVPDTFGTGGEFFVSGRASLLDDPQLRTVASEAATYRPEDRYVLFELGIKEARCNGYGDLPLRDPGCWTESVEDVRTLEPSRIDHPWSPTSPGAGGIWTVANRTSGERLPEPAVSGGRARVVDYAGDVRTTMSTGWSRPRIATRSGWPPGCSASISG